MIKEKPELLVHGCLLACSNPKEIANKFFQEHTCLKKEEILVSVLSDIKKYAEDLEVLEGKKTSIKQRLEKEIKNKDDRSWRI